MTYNDQNTALRICEGLDKVLRAKNYELADWYLNWFPRSSPLAAVEVLRLTFPAKKVLPSRRTYYEDTQCALVDMGLNAAQVIELLADLK